MNRTRENILNVFWLGTLLHLMFAMGYAGERGIETQPVTVALHEKIWLCTDRPLYITGESMWYRAFYVDKISNRELNLSRFIYVELLSENNQVIVRKTVKKDSSCFHGVIEIPENLRSGFYTLRAYSRWMSNNTAEAFANRQVKIVNPYVTTEIEIPAINDSSANNNTRIDPSVTNEIAQHLKDSSFADSMPGKTIDSNVKTFQLPEQLIPRVNIHFSPATFKSRKDLDIEVEIKNATGYPVEANLSVSIYKWDKQAVTKEFIIPETMMRGTIFDPENEMVYEAGTGPGNQKIITPVNDVNLHYYTNEGVLPETEGMVLSGLIISPVSRQPLGNREIYCAMADSISRLYHTKTGEDGSFNIMIKDYSGQKEFIIRLPNDTSAFIVQWDDQFSGSMPQMPLELFTISEWEAKLAESYAMNQQIRKSYGQYDQKVTICKMPEDKYSFYGTPDFTLHFDRYILLPVMEEYFFELLRPAMVRGGKDDKHIRIRNLDNNIVIGDSPLCMIDGIPVSNHNEILKLNTEEIKRIEVVDKKYFYGSLQMDGILHVISHNADFHMTDYPEYNRKIFIGPECPEQFVLPGYSNDFSKNSPIPDLRNTLYWVPQIKTNLAGKASVKFSSSDETGIFLIEVNGITAEGIAFIHRETMVVQ